MKVRISSFKYKINSAKNILIRGTNWIGDAVMTLPAVAAIRNNFPEAKISILAKPWVSEIYKMGSHVDRIIPFNDPGIHSGVKGKIKLAEELKSENFDMAILLQNAIEAAIITWLAGIPVRAGYNSDARGLLLTHSVQRTKEIKSVHQTQYYLEMLASLGFKIPENKNFFQPGEEYRILGEELLKKYHVKQQALIVGISPGAAYGPAKRWLPERFAAVADRLIDENLGQVILFGSADDRAVVSQVEQSARNYMINVSGKTDLKEAMALILKCSLFITNDSGLMHIAGTMNTPTVAIFGSTNPATTSPAGEKSVVIYKRASCSPCLKQVCPTDFRCMENISVDDVYEASIRLLK